MFFKSLSIFLIFLTVISIYGDKKLLTIKKLYEKTLKFNKNGEPLIIIGITDIDKTLKLKILKDMKLNKISIPKGEIIKIEYKTLSKGVSNRWLILDKYPYDSTINIDLYKKFIKKYIKKNQKIKTVVVGNLSAIKGNVIDIRKKLIIFGPFKNLKKMERIKQKIYRELKLKCEQYSEISKYPSGKIHIYYKDKLVYSVKNILPLNGKYIKFIDIKHGYERKRKLSPSFEGRVYLSINFEGKLSISNEIKIERLLRGVVPAEIYASAPMEALKAQTVAARTDILSKIGTRHFGDPYYICGTIHCQMYTGKISIHPRTDKAIWETYGEVMVDKDGIIDAYYSANSGGYSENNENVWLSRARVSLRGRDDFINWKDGENFLVGITEKNIKNFIDNPPKSYSSISSFSKKGVFRWSKKYNLKKLQKFVNLYFKKYRLKRRCKIKNLKHKGRGVSGRIVSLDVLCLNRKNNFTIYGELEIRKFLGFLKSSMFYMVKKFRKGRVSEITFKGGGWGHGVGMSQTGAIGMAEMKKSYKDILEHYYTGIKFLKLYKK